MTLASLQTKALPDFVPNQVLTDAQLNQLRDYLDGQTRLGRVRTVGQGVACGLTVARGGTNAAPTVVLAGGFGLSSDGYLLEWGATETAGDVAFAETTFTRAAAYTDPAIGGPGGGDGAPSTAPTYGPWQTADGAAQIALLQLLRDGDAPADPDADARPLAADDLDGAAVVLYLEEAPEDLGGCFVTTCDDRGRWLRHAVRVLLVDPALVADVTAEAEPEGPPPRARVPRHHAALDGGATGLQTLADLREGATAAAREGWEAVGEALRATADRYGPALGLAPAAADGARDALDALDAAIDEAPLVVLDHLRHLADAVAAFGRAACAAVGPCDPAGGHPRHLLLGRSDGAGGDRHLFRPAPPLAAGDAGRARRAFRRAVALAGAFDLGRALEAETVTVTASQTPRHPLGTRALPGYYDPEAVRALWADGPCDPPPLSVHDEDPAGGLDAAYGGVSLLRVEGHVGQTVGGAVSALEKRRAQLGLEFSLLVAYEGEEPPAPQAVPLATFFAEHPGAEPVGGVEPGGTFVLVADGDQQVLADLALRCCAGRPAEPEGPTTATLVVEVLHDGEPLSTATVTLRRVVDGTPVLEATRTTGGAGTVTFPALEPGRFTIRVTKAGFQTTNRTGIVIEAGDAAEETIPLVRDVQTGFVQILTCGAGEEPLDILIDDEIVVRVENGGTGYVSLDEGPHKLALASPKGSIIGTPLEGFRLRTAAAPVEFDIEAERLTTLFIATDAGGTTTVTPDVADVPDVAKGEVRVRVYHGAGLRGLVTLAIEEPEIPLAEGLKFGQVSEPEGAPADDVVLVLTEAEATLRFALPLADDGGQTLAIVLCNGALYYVLPESGGARAFALVKGGDGKGTDLGLDVVAEDPGVKDQLLARTGQRAKDVEAAGKEADILGTATYRGALAFIEETAPRSDIPATDLTDAFEETAARIASTLKNTTPEKRPAYEALLEATTHSYLDRVARYQDGGGAAVTVGLTGARTTLEESGVSVEGTMERWNAPELQETLGDAAGAFPTLPGVTLFGA